MLFSFEAMFLVWVRVADLLGAFVLRLGRVWVTFCCGFYLCIGEGDGCLGLRYC